MNVELTEGECTSKIITKLELNTDSDTHTPFFSSHSFILACQYYCSATGNRQIAPSNKENCISSFLSCTRTLICSSNDDKLCLHWPLLFKLRHFSVFFFSFCFIVAIVKGFIVRIAPCSGSERFPLLAGILFVLVEPFSSRL